jgi:hypothetical protein
LSDTRDKRRKSGINVGLSKSRTSQRGIAAPGDSGKRRQDISRRKFRYTLFAGPSAARGAQPETVNQAQRVNSRRWQTMRGVTKALSSLRPAGCSLPANIQSSVHSPLWNGKRARMRARARARTRERERGRRRKGSPINYMGNCARIIYVRIHRHEPRALGHVAPRRATLLHATPRRAHARSSPQRLSIARQRGHK